MPQSRKEKDEQAVALVREAANTLRQEGRTDLADAVDSTLSVDHLALLKRAAWSAAKEGVTNLPMYMGEAERAHIKDSIDAQRRTNPDAPNLEGRAVEALNKFLAGQFTPTRPPRGVPGKKVNLNSAIDEALRDRANAHGEDLADELGWKPSAAQVVRSYLLDVCFPMPE